MSSNSIELNIENKVAYIKLNRPEVFNSFNREMALSLQNVLDNCANDNQVRAIVIAGNGKAFCAGQDLAEVVDPNGPGMNRILYEHYNPIVNRIRDLDKPIVAAVNGVAAGAGANIALCCDIVVANENANFIQAFSKIGLIPDSGGTFFLPRLIGLQRASALMMTGDKVIYDANLPREKALLYFSKQHPSVVVMEACGGSNWWAQKLSSMGHSVKLISPQFVKPFASR